MQYKDIISACANVYQLGVRAWGRGTARGVIMDVFLMRLVILGPEHVSQTHA